MAVNDRHVGAQDTLGTAQYPWQLLGERAGASACTANKTSDGGLHLYDQARGETLTDPLTTPVDTAFGTYTFDPASANGIALAFVHNARGASAQIGFSLTGWRRLMLPRRADIWIPRTVIMGGITSGATAKAIDTTQGAGLLAALRLNPVAGETWYYADAVLITSNFLLGVPTTTSAFTTTTTARIAEIQVPRTEGFERYTVHLECLDNGGSNVTACAALLHLLGGPNNGA